MKLHSATINGVERVGWVSGDCFRWVDTNRDSCYAFVKDLTNLHPVETYNPETHKVVPKDAVVIEGVSEEKFVEDMNVLLSRTPYDDFIRRSFVRDVLKQLTSPLPEEPKVVLKKSTVDELLICLDQYLNFNMGHNRVRDLMTSFKSLRSDLINPVIISEGVE